MQPRWKATTATAHDGDLHRFHPADEPGFLVLVRQLTGRGGKQEKRQDEQPGAQVDERIGFPQALTRGLIGDEDNQCVLVDVIVERTEELGQKERSKTPLLQQRELTACRDRRTLRCRYGRACPLVGLLTTASPGVRVCCVAIRFVFTRFSICRVCPAPVRAWSRRDGSSRDR